jgi:hypothetical protein
MSRPRSAPHHHQAAIFPREPSDLKERRVNELAARVSRTLGVARALAENGRRLDLDGIQDGIGILCAQTLDLPTQDARCMLPVLREVLAKVNALSATLQQEAPFRERAQG